MARLHCTIGSVWQRLSMRVEEEWFVLRLTMCSLCYNSLTSWTTVIDTVLEPMFWFVEHFIRYLGPIFVVLVVVLTTAVVVIVYICLLPVKMSHSYFWGVYHIIFGHWLLINIVFNYFKAAFTNPGCVPEGGQIPVVSGICKKCIAPKPPRAHHCSVCNRCIMKMDHHCPWLNNCVGHGNHRYFLLFCTYMWIGCMYVSILAYPLFREHFLGSKDDGGWSGLLYPVQVMLNAFSFFTASKSSIDGKLSPASAVVASRSRTTPRPSGLVVHNVIAFEFLLCSAACVALGGLLLWHIRLVHRAETSVEVHTNRQEASRQKKLGLDYRNPYNFGGMENWRIFFGLSHGRTFFRNVLLPSSHQPEGDGLTWRMAHDYQTRLKEVLSV